MEPDLYEVLQVQPGADPDVIEAAFRRLSRKYHPDLNPAPDATAVTQRLTAAYAVLRDPDRRAAYDRERARRRAGDVPVRRAQAGVRSSGQDGEAGVDLSLLGGLAQLGIKWTKRLG